MSLVSSNVEREQVNRWFATAEALARLLAAVDTVLHDPGLREVAEKSRDEMAKAYREYYRLIDEA